MNFNKMTKQEQEIYIMKNLKKVLDKEKELTPVGKQLLQEIKEKLREYGVE